MSLKAIIETKVIFTQLKSQNKSDVLRELTEELFKKNKIDNVEQFYEEIMKRELHGTTFLDNMIAIPHAKSSTVKEIAICFGVSNNSISNDIDYQVAKSFFMIAVPEQAYEEHLEILSKLSQYLIDDNFCIKLHEVKSLDDLISLFREHDENKSIIEEHAYYDIVVITACPIGIAHTYLAADSLTKIANVMGIKIKIQTNGSIGIKNPLSKSDIKNARAAILAVDIDIDDSDFDGKHVIRVSVASAIRKSEEIIKKALNNKKRYKSRTIGRNNNLGIGNLGLYGHLLNGVSFMIPFVVVGGILSALAIFFGDMQANNGVIIENDILKKVSEIGGLAFNLMIPILAGYIGYSISGKAALAPSMLGGALAGSMGTGFLGGILVGFIAGYVVKYLVKIKVHEYVATIMPIIIIPLLATLVVAIMIYLVGGYIALFMTWLSNFLKTMHGTSVFIFAILGVMIAVDTGGPINKVAFLFGVSMIAEGVPEIMGAIGVAICIPPIAMGVATFISPKKYSKEEQQAGKAALAMGAIGITEGAIPFAAADPIIVIPSMVIGSAVGTMVAGFLKVANYAPHGGLIVLPVVENKIGFLIAILIGVSTTVVIVNLLKKTKY